MDGGGGKGGGGVEGVGVEGVVRGLVEWSGKRICSGGW